MAEAVYKVIELVGTSSESWEKAAKAAVDRAAKSLRDLRVAEVVQLDMQLKNGKVEAYRGYIDVEYVVLDCRHCGRHARTSGLGCGWRKGLGRHPLNGRTPFQATGCVPCTGFQTCAAA